MENYETWLVGGVNISNPKLIFTECLTLCVYSFYIHYYSPQEFDRTWGLNSWCKTDQADFTDWMPLLSNLMEEISLYPETLIANT